MRHVIDLVNEGKYAPEICTVDCGTLNVGDGNRTYRFDARLCPARRAHLPGARR